MNFLKYIKNPTVLVLVDQAIFSGSNFLLTFILARLFSIADFGLYSYIIIATYFLLSVSNAIIIQPFQLIIFQKPLEKAMGFALKLFFALLIFIFCIGLLLKVAFCYDFFSYPKELAFIFDDLIVGILLFISGYLFQDFFRKTLLAQQKIKLVLIIEILFLFVFFFFLQKNISLHKTLLGVGIFNFISAIPGLVYFLKKAHFKAADNFYKEYHFQNGKWLLSTAVLQWLSSNSMLVISGIYLGLEALGALRLVQSFFGILNVVLQTVENFFLPKIAQLYYKNKQQASDYLHTLTKQGLMIFGSILLVTFLLSTPIVQILGGEKYSEYGYVVKLISLLYLFIFFGYPVRIEIRILELNKYFFFGYVWSTLFTLCSFHVLLKYFDLIGAVLGLIISQVIMIAFWKFQLNKKMMLWI